MFSNLTDFGFERSAKQAIGFYIAYFFLCIILGAFAGGMTAMVTGDSSFEMGARAGTITAAVVCMVLAFLIVVKKNKLGSFPNILIAASSGLIALFIGALGGLVPGAYLTTVPAASDEAVQQESDEPTD